MSATEEVFQPFQSLPAELYENVFEFLDEETMGKVALVSKSFLGQLNVFYFEKYSQKKFLPSSLVPYFVVIPHFRRYSQFFLDTFQLKKEGTEVLQVKANVDKQLQAGSKLNDFASGILKKIENVFEEKNYDPAQINLEMQYCLEAGAKFSHELEGRGFKGISDPLIRFLSYPCDLRTAQLMLSDAHFPVEDFHIEKAVKVINPDRCKLISLFLKKRGSKGPLNDSTVRALLTSTASEKDILQILDEMEEVSGQLLNSALQEYENPYSETILMALIAKFKDRLYERRESLVEFAFDAFRNKKYSIEPLRALGQFFVRSKSVFRNLTFLRNVLSYECEEQILLDFIELEKKPIESGCLQNALGTHISDTVIIKIIEHSNPQEIANELDRALYKKPSHEVIKKLIEVGCPVNSRILDRALCCKEIQEQTLLLILDKTVIQEIRDPGVIYGHGNTPNTLFQRAVQQNCPEAVLIKFLEKFTDFDVQRQLINEAKEQKRSQTVISLMESRCTQSACVIC